MSPLRARLLRGYDAFVHGLVRSATSPGTKAVQRAALFVWVAFNTLSYLPLHAHFWGARSYGGDGLFNPDNPFHWYSRVMMHPRVAPYYPLFIAVQLGAALLALLGIRLWTMTLLVHVTTVNLFNKAWMTLDGGHNLVSLMLTYMLFMNLPQSDGGAPVQTALSNAALVMMRLQVVAVYLTAGLCKVGGELWQSGMALFYVLQVDRYSHPAVRGLLADHAWMSVVATYATVAFQLAFPPLVWVRRARPWLLAAGVFFHLQIAFVMGLTTFGLAMIVAYACFLPEAWSQAILRAAQRWRRAVLAAPDPAP